MRKAAFRLGILSIASIFIACSTSYVESRPLNLALVVIDQAIESAMSMGVAGYSENHREFYSRPFQIVQTDEAIHSGFRERGVAKVIIYGDSRPYSIDVEVRVERARILKDPTAMRYERVRYDKRLGQRLLQSIMNVIEHRERDKNIIDDFRSF